MMKALRPVLTVLLTTMGLCLPRSGHAEEAPSTQCHSETTRAAESIIVPVDKRSTPDGPRLGVLIEPGETLCLAGTMDPMGEVKHLHLVDEASGEAPLLSLTAGLVGTENVIAVESYSSRPIEYRSSFVYEPANIALPSGTKSIAPHGHTSERWETDAPRSLLYGFRSDGPYYCFPPEARFAGRPPLRERTGNISVNLGGGIRYASLGAFNRILQERGYTALPDVIPTFGIGIGGVYKRFRFDFSGHFGGHTSKSREGEGRISTSVTELVLAGGYDVFRIGGFSAFGLVGAGVSWVATDPRVLQVDAEDDRIEQQAGIATLELGAEQVIPLGQQHESFTLVFGVRGGVLLPFVGDAWHLDDKHRTKVSGPDVDAVGVRVLLVAGIGAIDW